jgi:hypothetical protein
LERVWLGEINGDLVGGELLVNLFDGINSVLDLVLIKRVDVDLDVFLSIKSNSSVLSSDSGRVDLLIMIN